MQIDLYNYKDNTFICKNCGWKGSGDELSLGEIFMDSAIVEYDCPKCFEKIASGQGSITNEDALLKFEDSKRKTKTKVFEMGGEGGSISINTFHNELTDSQWYYFEVYDMGFDEENNPASHRKSKSAYTFWEALVRLRDDKPLFYRLYPVLVHQNSRNDVISRLRLIKDSPDFEMDYDFLEPCSGNFYSEAPDADRI